MFIMDEKRADVLDIKVSIQAHKGWVLVRKTNKLT
jgi:hypothetical protein